MCLLESLFYCNSGNKFFFGAIFTSNLTQKNSFSKEKIWKLCAVEFCNSIYISGLSVCRTNCFEDWCRFCISKAWVLLTCAVDEDFLWTNYKMFGTMTPVLILYLELNKALLLNITSLTHEWGSSEYIERMFWEKIKIQESKRF